MPSFCRAVSRAWIENEKLTVSCNALGAQKLSRIDALFFCRLNLDRCAFRILTQNFCQIQVVLHLMPEILGRSDGLRQHPSTAIRRVTDALRHAAKKSH